jgi:imidazoleglycerol-phosphate dehydratase
MKRIANITRKTNETDIAVTLNIDGAGQADIETPIGFFTHMLESFAKHGSFDLQIKAGGDIHVDQHHLVEDCGIVLGRAFDKALSGRRGIRRAGFFIMPMDDALATAAVDFGGRPYLLYEAAFTHQYCGGMETGLLEDFLRALANGCNANLVVRITHGRSDHHKAEASIKALARAVRAACEPDSRNASGIPSTKGVI